MVLERRSTTGLVYGDLRSYLVESRAPVNGTWARAFPDYLDLAQC